VFPPGATLQRTLGPVHRDGGVYMEVEAVSLTRNVPRAVRAVSRPMAAGTRR
jgi:hypothetical protein